MTPTKANDFSSWSHKEIADYFWQNLRSYEKEQNFQTLQNIKYAYLWAVHNDHDLAKTISKAIK